MTIHDTAVDGTTPFDANALAKAAHATPFKRPENGQFRPGIEFTRVLLRRDRRHRTRRAPRTARHGGCGAILKLTQSKPVGGHRHADALLSRTRPHTGFDNVAFSRRNADRVRRGRGDALHTQRNALDSGFVFDVTRDYSKPANQPVRLIAEGRDPSATIDAAQLPGSQERRRQRDHRHPRLGRRPGAAASSAPKTPSRSTDGWRWFYTQQHGDNMTYEVTSKDDDHDGYFDGHDHD